MEGFVRGALAYIGPLSRLRRTCRSGGAKTRLPLSGPGAFLNRKTDCGALGASRCLRTAVTLFGGSLVSTGGRRTVDRQGRKAHATRVCRACAAPITTGAGPPHPRSDSVGKEDLLLRVGWPPTTLLEKTDSSLRDGRPPTTLVEQEDCLLQDARPGATLFEEG